MNENSPLDVKSIRSKTGFKQSEFAKLIGVSLSLVESWEQGRRFPTGPASKILSLLESYPDIIPFLTKP